MVNNKVFKKYFDYSVFLLRRPWHNGYNVWSRVDYFHGHPWTFPKTKKLNIIILLAGELVMLNNSALGGIDVFCLIQRPQFLICSSTLYSNPGQ